MTIKEAVKESYNLLPQGGKRLPSKILGVTYEHFTCIVNGKVKRNSISYEALAAIGNAAKRYRVDLNNQLDQIDSIINQVDNKN